MTPLTLAIEAVLLDVRAHYKHHPSARTEAHALAHAIADKGILDGLLDIEDTLKHQNETLLMQAQRIETDRQQAAELRDLILRAFYDSDAQLTEEWKQDVRELLAPFEGTI